MKFEKSVLFLCVSVSLLMVVAFFIVHLLGNYYALPGYVYVNFFVVWVVLSGWALLTRHYLA